jgi:transposase-like protein
MDPHIVFCPNEACAARGQVGQGNIHVHSQKDRRYQCTVCGTTFAETKGTPFYRLRTAQETVTWVITLLAYGCPVQAIVAAFDLDERTVQGWQHRAGWHCQPVHAHLVEQLRDLGQVQADELRVKRQGGIVWMALALQVSTRLWLGGVIAPQRTLACALRRQGRRGRKRLQPWRGVSIAQVVKRYAGRRVVAVTRRIVQGRRAAVERLLRQTQDGGGIHTAYIERLNATFRARLGPLVRRSRALARHVPTLEHGLYLIGTVYNFCTAHRSLRLRCRGRPDHLGHRWHEHTPAMAAGITDHSWRVLDLLSFHVPPPRWTPPPRRGRWSKATHALVVRWCS